MSDFVSQAWGAVQPGPPGKIAHFSQKTRLLGGFCIFWPSPLRPRAQPIFPPEVTAANAAPLTDLLRSAHDTLFDAAKLLQGIRRAATCVWDTLAVPTERTPDLALTILD